MGFGSLLLILTFTFIAVIYFVTHFVKLSKGENPLKEDYRFDCLVFSFFAGLSSIMLFKTLLHFSAEFLVEKPKNKEKIEKKDKKDKKIEENKVRVKFPLYVKKNSNDIYSGARKKDIVDFHLNEYTPSTESLLNGESIFLFKYI